MEVRQVESYPLAYSMGEGRGYGSARGTVNQRMSTLVRVETDDGLVGWGEAFGPPRTMATLVEELLTDLVVGTDPYEVESLCERTYTGLYHFGASGLVQSAVSGVDIALWDIIGKATEQPIHRLLGGANRTAIPLYASTMYVTEWGEDPEEPIRRAVDEGFTAAKIKIGRNFEDDVERTRIAREALGEDGTLMVDVNGNYRADQAIRLAEKLRPFDVHWLEEPVPPEDVEGYAEVRAATDVPIAGGEAVYARFGYQELFENRAVDIVQPDVCKCGGIAEARFIANMATTSNVTISPHCWTGGVGLAASLQYAAALPEYPHSMNIPEPLLFEFDRADNKLRNEILVDPFDPTGGSLDVPQDPGLGVDVDEDALNRFQVRG